MKKQLTSKDLEKIADYSKKYYTETDPTMILPDGKSISGRFTTFCTLMATLDWLTENNLLTNDHLLSIDLVMPDSDPEADDYE